MAASFHLRLPEQSDYKAILSLVRIAVEEDGDAFAWDGDVSNEELAAFWLPGAAAQRQTFVAEGDDGSGSGRLAGVCALYAPAAGRAVHCASLAVVVVPAARGRGLAKRLVAHAVEEARRRGFTGLRLDAVVASNSAAVRVCSACGFKVLCTVPKCFDHPERGPTDTHVMWCDLSPPQARRSSLSGAALPQVAPPPSAATSLALSLRASGSSRGRDAADGLQVAVGEEVSLEPFIGTIPCSAFRPGSIAWSVEPPLPEGLQFDAATGQISGAAVRPGAVGLVQVTATLTADVDLQVTGAVAETSALSAETSSTVSGKPAQAAVDEEFASHIERVVRVSDLPAAPSRIRQYGNWMVWMVHRVWLNDPTLTELDFTSLEMPSGHIEKRIAPKLAQALEHNTHLKVLSLTNANMQKAEAAELAKSMSKNTTLVELNLEGNMLDPTAVRDIAVGVMSNPNCALEAFRVCHQKQMGQFFGRRTEEAVGMMMEQNGSIVKLGFECDDPHWRNVIDRALLRNNDVWRRAASPPDQEETPVAEVLTLSHLMFQAPPPDQLSTDIFPRDSGPHTTFRRYVEQNNKLPTTSQLQSFAKNLGAPVTYATAAPLIKECRTTMLTSAEGTDVVLIDAYGQDTVGLLRSWSEVNEQWSIELLVEGKRLVFKSSKEPGFSLSPAWGEWLGSPSRRSLTQRAGA